MTLSFSFVAPENANKRAVILFHGLTGTPFELKKYGKFLSNNGFDVFADCLPGHGDFADDIYTVKFEEWIEFAGKRFEEISQKYEEVYLGGICLGAVLSLAVAEKFGARVKGVAAFSTTLFLDGWRLPWYSFLMPFGLNTVFRYYYTYPECEPYGIKNVRTRNIIKGLIEKSDVSLDNFPMCAIYELLRLSGEVRENLAKVEIPLLVVHSREDDLTSLKSAYCAYENVSSKDKELVILEDSYHMVLYDNEKEFVYEKSLQFFERLSGVRKEVPA